NSRPCQTATIILKTVSLRCSFPNNSLNMRFAYTLRGIYKIYEHLGVNLFNGWIFERGYYTDCRRRECQIYKTSVYRYTGHYKECGNSIQAAGQGAGWR